MDDLQVDNQLPATVVDDEHSDATSAIVKGSLNLSQQPSLVHDPNALLDVTSLGHGNDLAIVTDVQHAILFEDGAQHSLDHHRGLGVADKG